MKILLYLFLVLLAGYANAQILKVDKGYLATDSSNYLTGIVDAAFAINNTSSTAETENLYVGFRNNFDLVYVADESATILISGLNYFKLGNGPLIFNGTAHLREVFRRKEKFTPEAYLQFQFDESRNMELRWLGGGGYRYNIHQKKNALFTGLGLFREYERWKGETEDLIQELWKLNYYISADIKFSRDISINAILYYQTGRDGRINAFRNRVSGQFEFKNTISRHFKIKLTYMLLLDEKPVIPLNKFTYDGFLGIEYVL